MLIKRSRCTMAQIAFKMPIKLTQAEHRLIRSYMGLFHALILNFRLFYV